jgi:[ribosomal protein S18]-alanine N-acetyltransferase
MMGIIRALEISDTDALTRFFVENDRPEIRTSFHPFPLTGETAAAICANPSGDQYFAHFEPNSILGFGMLRGWKEGFAVPSFGVLVDHRVTGQGIGSALMAHALKRARDLGSPAVRLTVHPTNERAIGIYSRAGFQTTERLPDGRLVMRVELK